MRIIEGKQYFSKKEVAQLIGKSITTLNIWDKLSNEREEAGQDRYIPKPIRWGMKDYRLWSLEDIEAIKDFAKTVKYGTLEGKSYKQFRKEEIIQ